MNDCKNCKTTDEFPYEVYHPDGGISPPKFRTWKEAFVQFHYSLDRRLTVRECARLQTFPDTFDFPHSATSNIMQIGNAVPPILGNKVARAIAKYLEGVTGEK